MTIYALNGTHPQLHEDTWVAADANIVGNVILEAAASVWFGSIVRGDNEPIIVGEGTNVQEDCVFHTDPGAPMPIGRDCTIGHKVMLHGCTVGDNSLIGMGSIILNNTKIGKNCLIGANTLIAEGKEIPDNSMVLGAPGKVIRTLSDEQAAGLEMSAAHYVANWQHYARDLKPIG